MNLVKEVPATPAPPGSLDQLNTPAVLVDRRQLQRNIDAMAARVRAAGVELWPHVKTHKSWRIADLQIKAGATGVTAATLTEAEMLVDHGIWQILLAYPPVSGWRRERVAALAGRCSLIVTCDQAEEILELERVCTEAGVTARYLWEVDCGTHRCGTDPGEKTAELVAAVARRTRATTFAGLMTFPGHAYGAECSEELAAIAQQELDAIRVTAAALEALGIECPVQSIGSTPTIHHLPAGSAGMLARPGNYVFYDATQVALGLVSSDQCALTVLATVISKPAADRFVLDSGSKALSTDRMTELAPGYGSIVGNPDVTVAKLFEEHAIVHGPASALSVGDRVRIIPNHSCAVTNLHHDLHIIQEDEIVDRWPVDAHGWTWRPR